MQQPGCSREKENGGELAFSRTFGIVLPFPRVPGELDEDNKLRAMALCSARYVHADNNGFRLARARAREDGTRFIYARGFKNASIRVTLRSGSSKASSLSLPRETKKNIGRNQARERSPCVIPQGVSGDLHQTPEADPLMNLATIFLFGRKLARRVIFLRNFRIFSTISTTL